MKGENYFSTHNTSDTKCVDFPQQDFLQFSVDTSWVSYILIQFSNYLELLQTPQFKSSVPQDFLPQPTSEANHK